MFLWLRILRILISRIAVIVNWSVREEEGGGQTMAAQRGPHHPPRARATALGRTHRHPADGRGQKAREGEGEKERPARRLGQRPDTRAPGAERHVCTCGGTGRAWATGGAESARSADGAGAYPLLLVVHAHALERNQLPRFLILRLVHLPARRVVRADGGWRAQGARRAAACQRTRKCPHRPARPSRSSRRCGIPTSSPQRPGCWTMSRPWRTRRRAAERAARRSARSLCHSLARSGCQASSRLRLPP